MPTNTHQLAASLNQLANQLQRQATAPLPEEVQAHWQHLQTSLATITSQAVSTADTNPQLTLSTDKGVLMAWGDGSCSPNPGPGGWGVVLIAAGERYEYSGSAPEATNNTMELTAAIEALKHTPPGAKVVLHSDSRYVVDGMTKWLKGWQKKGWRKSTGGSVLNQPYWRTLAELAAERRVTWQWVRGHVGNLENERCDTLANQARLAL